MWPKVYNKAAAAGGKPMESPDQTSTIVIHPPDGLLLMQLKLPGNTLHSSSLRIVEDCCQITLCVSLWCMVVSRLGTFACILCLRSIGLLI